MKRIADCIVPSSATFAAGARTEDSGGALAAGFVVLRFDDGVLELRIAEWSLSIVLETRNVSLWLTVESFEAALKITCATARTAIREQPWEAAPIRPTRWCSRCRGADESKGGTRQLRDPTKSLCCKRGKQTSPGGRRPQRAECSLHTAVWQRQRPTSGHVRPLSKHVPVVSSCCRFTRPARARSLSLSLKPSAREAKCCSFRWSLSFFSARGRAV